MTQDIAPEAAIALRQTLCDQLRQEGIVKIIISASGEGDSGDIDNIAFIKKIEDGSLLMVHTVSFLNDATVIENWAWDIFDGDHAAPDWINNDGGVASIEINLDSDTPTAEVTYQYREMILEPAGVYHYNALTLTPDASNKVSESSRIIYSEELSRTVDKKDVPEDTRLDPKENS